MADQEFKVGYQKGRIDGYNAGRAWGVELGIKAARSLAVQTTVEEEKPQQQLPEFRIHPIHDQPREMTKELILEKFNDYSFEDSISATLNQNAVLVPTLIEKIKDSYKSSIWKLHLRVDDGVKPIILKVVKAHDKYLLGEIEWKVYKHATGILSELMPRIYAVESGVNGPEHWIFMEFVKTVEDQVVFHPKHFDQIIPALAELHARTYEEKFYVKEDIFMPWLPMYHSTPVYNRRNEKIEQTKRWLAKAVKEPHLKKWISPHDTRILRALERGPHFFPELLRAGQSIIHDDLQMKNIGFNSMSRNASWDIQFLDWEGARFAPCWFDMYNLVGVFLAYRDDWHEEEESIIHHCASLYADEMRKHGIVFQTEPLVLYRMAYLQSLFERDLLRQLIWACEKQNKGILLKNTIKRIVNYGEELHLF